MIKTIVLRIYRTFKVYAPQFNSLRAVFNIKNVRKKLTHLGQNITIVIKIKLIEDIFHIIHVQRIPERC